LYVTIKIGYMEVKTQLVYWLGKAMVLIKQHVSAYLEAIIRFTNVGYRRLVPPNIHAHTHTSPGVPTSLGSSDHHTCKDLTTYNVFIQCSINLR